MRGSCCNNSTKASPLRLLRACQQQIGPIDDPRRGTLALQLIRDDAVTARPQQFQRLLNRLALHGREDERRTVRPQPAEDQVEHLQPHERQHRGRRRDAVHPRPRSHAYAGNGPQTRRRGQAAHDLAVEDDRAGPDETDAADDLRRHAARIEPQSVMIREELLEAPLRHDHEERTAQRNEKVGAESRLLDAPLALDADHRTQQAGHHQPKDKNPSHNLTL